MKDAEKIRSTELSRRLLLRSVAFTAGGAAILGMSAGRFAAAQSKMTQNAVGYQDTPQGAQRCDNCTQFEPPSSCKVVEGNINPAGWCKVYMKKPAG